MEQIMIITPGECEVRNDQIPPALTPSSRQQALELRKKLSTSFDGAYFIPGPGAAQTAYLIAGQEMKDIPQEVPLPPNLIRNPNGKVLSIAQEQLGMTRLTEYLKRDLAIHLRFAAHEYHNTIMQLARGAKYKNMLLVANPVLAPMLAIVLSPQIPENEFINQVLGYHQGYRFKSQGVDSPYWDAESVGLSR